MVFSWGDSSRRDFRSIDSMDWSVAHGRAERPTLERIISQDAPPALAPIFVACRDGKMADVRALLQDDGVDVAATDHEGRTPLHVAAMKGYAAIVAVLLAAGANAATLDSTGNTALHLAAEKGHAETVKVLATCATCDVNSVDHNRWTALHIAVSLRRYTVVRALITVGADLHAVDKEGTLPLHIACESNHFATTRLLLEAGADPLAMDLSGRASLHRAITCSVARTASFEKLVQLVRLLVTSGAVWDAQCDALVTRNELEPKVAALGVCVVQWTHDKTAQLRFTDVPFETLENGPDATRTYIKELKKSTDIISRRKICMVGPSKAGKTSLVKSLTTRVPCLEHTDDRTIGIDQFQHRFLSTSRASGGVQTNDVTFWDFAGQDEYQVAHSLFYSRRALFLVCIDLEAYLVAHMQARLMTDTPMQMQRLLNEFIERTTLRWVRSIFSLQPEAEFVFVATKDDLLSEPKQFTSIVRDDLIQSLQYVQGIVAVMKTEYAQQAGLNPYSRASRTIHAYQTTVGIVPSRTDLSLIFVSCQDAASVHKARELIEALIVESDRSFVMPDSYSRVLEAVVNIRASAAKGQIRTRLEKNFVTIYRLVDALAYLEIDEATCLDILRVLHDLGDVLWYDELGLAYFQKTVVLDPMLLIDFVRQVISHTIGVETLAHDTLKGLPFWIDVLDEDHMLALKQMLQKFQLAHPTEGDMLWDSDVMVPTFWRSNTPASWLFGGEKVLLGPPKMVIDEAIRVHWEYHFTVEFPTSLMDHVVVASYSPFLQRRVGPDWILYHEREIYSCRIMVSRDLATKQRTLCLEAALAVGVSSTKQDELWEAFAVLSVALVRVLRRYPGLLVTSFALNESRELKRLESLAKFPLSISSRTWMPREATWDLYKQVLAE